MLKHPTDVLLFACALMSFWEGLYGADMQGKILEGVKILVSCVHKVMAQQKRSPTRLLLEGAASAAAPRIQLMILLRREPESPLSFE